MPVQIKVNPMMRDIGRSFVGKSVQGYTIDLGADMTDELGPNGVVQAVYFALAQRVTPVLISALYDGGTKFDYYVEGEFPEDDYDGKDEDDLTLAAHMQGVIRELGTTGVRDAEIAAVSGETESAGIDVSGATVAALPNAVFYADHVPA